MNKDFDRLALLYKISYAAEFKNNASFISTESHLQMPPHYEDLIKSYITTTFPSHQVSQEFVFYQYDLRTFWVLFVPSDNFHGLLMWLSQVDIKLPSFNRIMRCTFL